MKVIFIFLFMILMTTQSFTKDCSTYEARDILLVGTLCETAYDLEKIDSRFILSNGRDILAEEYPDYYSYIANSRYTRKDCNEIFCKTMSIQPIVYDELENKLKRTNTYYFIKVKK